MAQSLAMISRFAMAAIVVAALTPPAFTQQPETITTRSRAKATTSKDAQKTKPIARPRTATPCTEFGAGFVRMPGSHTCVRVGGSIDVGVGMSH